MSPIYDQLVNARSRRAGTAAMAVINALQDFIEDERGAQAIGIAAAFLLFCERFRIEPQDVFTATRNLIARSEGDTRKDFQAVRDYLTNEVT
jgi:hypothetical protein